MLTLVLPVVLAAAAAMAQTDTSFSIPEGSRLSLHNFAGSVTVRPWTKKAVRIQATHRDRTRIVIEREGTSYDVRMGGRHGVNSPVDYHISAPAWMSLDLEGFQCDMDIEGWKSDVLAETVRGDVRLQGGEGLIRLSSVTGAIQVTGARGKLQLSSVAAGVDVHDAAGEVSVEAVNGNVVLDHVRSRLVEVATVNGDAEFTGWIDEDGRYRLSTHRGNLAVLLPPGADASVSVSTFNGGFESAFPVRPTAVRPGRNFSFTLGTGRAMLDLESFEGHIVLKQGEFPPLPPTPPGR